MLEFFRTHAKKFQWVLFPLLLLGLGFVGIQGFSGFWDPSNTTVAKVDGHKISQAEWDNAHQRQLERMRQQMPNLDVKLLDTPEAKAETLNQLVRERTLLAAMTRQHMSVGDERLVRELNTSQELASLRSPDGRLDADKYKQLLQAQGMTPEMYEAQLRQQLAMRQVLGGVTGSALAASSVASSALDALFQRREVALLRVLAKDQAGAINPSDAELQAYHQANAAQFKAPEQASIEYVVLSLDALKAGVTVAEADLKGYYEQNAARFTVAEERRARHILVKAEKDTPADARAKARARAEALLAEVRKAPASFADVARKSSEDAGSAATGGDLDFFGRGMMTKPFEDATFAMKPGEVSNLVESEFGFHIILLEAVRGGSKKSFDEARVEITDELRKQQATKRWAEAAEAFTNTVYEQPDSLQPVIDKYKLEKKPATVQRSPAPGAQGPLASAKLLEAVFADDAVKNKRNTSAVDVGPNQLAAARVLSHQPARTLALAEVRDAVRARLVATKAAEAARRDGEKLLAQMRAQPQADLPGVEKLTVSRVAPQNLPRQAVEDILRADATKLPSFVGVALGDEGYVAVRVDKVLPREARPDDAQQQAAVSRAWGQAEALAYLGALKVRYKAEVKAPAASAAGTAAASAAAR
jgi:peptidyl-prolyl cis-trans isomerase D